ncbi:vacuolar sorting protein SNF7 [Plasmodium falciparum IGH-CR14]|uniref:Vacuolar sorting protein SNF7 n=1 Tax=Plasmodium falciparum IGH-CR14 TaxID=580059 RepID=A0A0L1IGY3_PLAFA|nr:vacuolar sorting protein SNF7 [Plasmodium falciparum IGH-CR14]
MFMFMFYYFFLLNFFFQQLEIEAKQKVQNNQMNSAKILLKRKKLYEQEIENILNNRLTLEDNMINLENMHLHKIAVSALSYAANTHKKLNNEMYEEKKIYIYI